MGVVFRCNQPTRYMTATGAAKRAKRKANNINSFSMATCRRFDTTQHPYA
jgi:DNA-directed RNA polymerase subunit K/omega